MNIHFDAHALLDTQKTGIGWTAYNLLKSLLAINQEHTYTLNYFSMRVAREKRAALQEFEELGCVINECRWFVNRTYKLLYNFIPVPYSLFFGSNADVTFFINYHVPPGVKGKVVTTVHDMVYKVFPETVNRKTLTMLNLGMERSCARADVIITVSEFSKKEIMKYLSVPSDKIVVMPCGVDLRLFHPNYNENQISSVKKKYGINGDYFLYLGTLEPRKNIVRLIEAYHLLRARNSCSPILVVAGGKGWQYGEIFKKVCSLGLQDYIYFTGYVDTRDIPALMKGALAFVFPSIYEGFGIPPLESMACGTPVITSNAASLPEVVGDAALLVDPYSVDSIAQGMDKILSDTDLRRKLSQKGIERASHFTWNSSAKILSRVFSNLS